MSRAVFWIAASAATVLAGCASGDQTERSATASNRQCFFASSVSGFASVDPRTVNVRVGARDVYRLDLMSSCVRAGSWNSGVRLVTRGSSSICTGSGLGTTLVLSGPTGRPMRCNVSNITLLTPEEVQALPARERP